MNDLWLKITEYLVVVAGFTVHECSHAGSAYLLGDPTAKERGRLTLNPIPHMNPIGSVLLPLAGIFLGGIPFAFANPTPIDPSRMRNPRLGRVLSALAGPASNLVIAATIMLVGRWLASYKIRTSDGLAYDFLLVLMVIALVNAVLFLFNLLPIPPLDGSHVLTFFMSEEQRQAWDRYAAFGLLVLLFFPRQLGALFRPVIDFIAKFMMSGAG